ncbi:MAG: hypothetical protein KTR25_13360 [Myxococcales bacterium]|nr:hypothetical protein [Myxococcales bacterium]
MSSTKVTDSPEPQSGISRSPLSLNGPTPESPVGGAEPLVFEGLDILAHDILYDSQGDVSADKLHHQVDEWYFRQIPGDQDCATDNGDTCETRSMGGPTLLDVSEPQNAPAEDHDYPSVSDGDGEPDVTEEQHRPASLASAIGLGSHVALPDASPPSTTPPPRNVEPRPTTPTVDVRSPNPPPPSAQKTNFVQPDEYKHPFNTDLSRRTDPPNRRRLQPKPRHQPVRMISPSKKTLPKGNFPLSSLSKAIYPSSANIPSRTAPNPADIIAALGPKAFIAPHQPQRSSLTLITITITVAFLTSLVALFLFAPKKPQQASLATLHFIGGTSPQLGQLDKSHVAQFREYCPKGLLIVGRASDILSSKKRRERAKYRAAQVQSTLATLGLSPKESEIMVDLRDHTAATVQLRCRM